MVIHRQALAVHVVWLMVGLASCPLFASPQSSPAGSAPSGAGGIPPKPKWIDIGPDPTRLQPCRGAPFVPLSAVLAKPVAGPVRVRGKVWLPATRTCTDGIPETCSAIPVLASSKPGAGPTEQTRGIALIGALKPGASLVCFGARTALRCPVPFDVLFDGTTYGVTGTLREESEDAWSIEVESLCRAQ